MISTHGWCDICREWFCATHTDDIPSKSHRDGAEMREVRATDLAARLFVALRDHLDPTRPRECITCRALLAEAQTEFQEMGIPTP